MSEQEVGYGAAVQRSRPVRLPHGSGLEHQLATAIKALGLPEPKTEWRFDRGCCGHPAKSHWYIAGKRKFCRACLPVDARHDYRRARMWRFDFAWPDRMLACEVEGGTWAGGRHTRGAGFQADCDKLNAAVLLGWRVLRVTGQDVGDGTAIELIERALEDAG